MSKKQDTSKLKEFFAQKYKEFWLENECQDDGTFEDIICTEEPHEFEYHVIEYEAFEEVVKENQKLRRELTHIEKIVAMVVDHMEAGMSGMYGNQNLSPEKDLHDNSMPKYIEILKKVLGDYNE